MTVSRALRGAPRNSAETRDRIRRIADELGYRPNPLMSALMSARSKKTSAANLAMLKMDGGQEVRGFADGVRQQAEQQGFSIEEFILHPPEMTAPRLRKILIARGVRGIVFLPAPRVPFHIDFDFEGFTAVAIGNSISHDRLPRVTTNVYASTLEAIRMLHKYGYGRIGIAFLEDLDTRFLHGISAAIEVAPSTISPSLVIRQFTPPDLREFSTFTKRHRMELVRWIGEHRLQVIVSQMDHVLDALLEEGLCIPEDLSYLHTHFHPDPKIACMDQMCHLIGRKAVDMVVAAINRNELSLPESPGVLMMPSSWRDGRSLPKLRAPTRRHQTPATRKR